MQVTIIRCLKTYAKFALNCSINGFDKAFNALHKLHESPETGEKRRPNYIKKRATGETRKSFVTFWDKARVIPPFVSQGQFFLQIYNDCKSRDRSKGKTGDFSLQSQREIFQSPQVIEFYDLILQFLGGSADNGLELTKAMRMQGEPECVKKQLFEEYLSCLGLHQVRTNP
jgi:hypothetical protein